jgi:hypothetical protein
MFSFLVSFRPTPFAVMRHSIAVCFLFCLSTLAHAQGAPAPCVMPPSNEWELLPAPPPESAQMLVFISRGLVSFEERRVPILPIHRTHRSLLCRIDIYRLQAP